MHNDFKTMHGVNKNVNLVHTRQAKLSNFILKSLYSAYYCETLR